MINLTTTVGVANDETSQFGAIDYAVVGLLLLASAALGIYFAYFDGTEQSTEEYLLGGRRMRPIPVAISLVASQLSASTVLMIPTEVYSFGLNYVMCLVPIVIGLVLAANYGILPVFYNNNIDNCYGYLEMRFGKETKYLMTLIFIILVMLVLPIYSFVPAFAFAQISGLDLHTINAVVIVVCVTYTMLGGVKAVIWTDVMQALVMGFTLLVVPALAIARIGGIGETWARAADGGRLELPSFVLDAQTRQTFWNMFCGLFIGFMSLLAFSQSSVQRLSSLPSLKHVQKSMFVFMMGVIIIQISVGLTGVVMFSYYADCDPVAAGFVSKADKLVPYFVAEVVGHIGGMPGLFMSCVFSASLSTVSAYMNCLAGLVYKDGVCKLPGYRHSETRANTVMKLTIVVLGVYCVAMGWLVERSSSLLQLQFMFFGMTTGTSFGVFGLGLFYPWASQKATLCGAVSSIVLMGWLTLGSMMHPTVYTPLPTSIEGCNRTMSNAFEPLIPTLMTSTPSPDINEDMPLAFYSISFQWYPVIGTSIVWLVGIVLSHTLYPVGKPVESRLLSPWLQWLVPGEQSTRGHHVEMQLVTGDGSKNNASSCNTESKYTIR